MKSKFTILIVVLVTIFMVSCNKKEDNFDMKIVFLHHSTGATIWDGRPPTLIKKVASRICKGCIDNMNKKSMIPSLLQEYNQIAGKNYFIEEKTFPQNAPYGWSNFPFDYYNIWVRNAGEEPYMEEPTIELLAKDYQVVIFKHCFPVSNIQEDSDEADINSNQKTLSIYKLQYKAIREKLHEFPSIKFVLFTGAAQVEYNISEDKAKRAKEFFDWVRNDWDMPNDNIYLWDLYRLQTEDGLYFKNEYAVSEENSHPNEQFASLAGRLFFDRLIDIIETGGSKTRLTGEAL